MKHVLILMVFLLILCNVKAETVRSGFLPNPSDILVIAVHPSPILREPYFTPSSLLEALPKFKPGEPKMRVGARRVWQSGVIVLKNKDVLFWRTAHDDFIIIDTKAGQQPFIIGDGKVGL